MSKYNFWLDATQLALLQAHLCGKVKTKESVQLERATEKEVVKFLNQLDSNTHHSEHLNQDFVKMTLSEFWKRLTYNQVYLHSLQNLVKTIYENKVKDELDHRNRSVTWYGSPDEASIEYKTSRFCSTDNEFDVSESLHSPIETFMHNQECKELVDNIIQAIDEPYQDVARGRLQGIPMKDLAQQRGLSANYLSVNLGRAITKVVPLFKAQYKQLFGN